MRRKEKDKDKQTKPQRRWGVGKTLAVVFASVAFIVGVAILGVYLADGFREHTTIPQDISFNEQNDPNYNADLNRLEITNNYNLTIGSTTENVTSDVVTLGFSRTYAYNFETKSFTDEGWGTTQTGDYIDNGVIRIPRQVRIGVPFTVEVLPYDYNYEINGEKKQADQIRGGISTIEAQSQNPDLTPISLTIAVDSPVQETKVVLLDAHGNEITPSGDISEVVEEEIFNVITKFYPEESRYVYANPEKTKTSFYQLSNVSSEVANAVYDSSTSLHFQAGITGGGNITAFTAVDAKVQEEVEEDVLDTEGLTDNGSIYNAYVNYYSKLAGEQVLTEQVEFNVVQANVDEFNVGSKGQTFDIHDLADLRIFLGDNAKAPDKCLGVQVISQNGASLNNILANVALSFSLKDQDQDPTIAQEGSSPILAIKGGDGQKLTPTVLDGVNYYFPYINEGVTDYKNAFWDLRVSEGYQNSEITVKVSLLLENEEDGYQLFELQEEFSLAVIKHEESDVSWAEGTDLTQELLLTYAEGSESPKPTTFSLAGLTDVPANNIFKTVAYFVGFDDSLLGEGDDSAKTASAITLARQIFDGLVDSSRAGVYQTATGDKILVPLIITGDTLTVQEVGQFNLYFASVNETAESGLYNVVKMVEEPITITVTKTLYINSVSGAQVLIDSALNEGGFTEVTESVFVPTISDNADKDQIQLVFTIALDSATVFEEEFQNGRISLEIYSNENIINSNFTISNGQFAISEEDQTATLTYTLTANSSFTVANDTPITAIALAYSGNSSVQPINWSFSNIYVSGNVSLYTPVPAESGVVLDKEGLVDSYEVEQILNTEGKFETTITPNNLSLADLISNITENISVSDQHNRTDTLRNSWTFTSNSSVLRISASAEGVAGQGFAFSGEGSAELGVSCKGINAENTISFNVSAQGITKIEYDANGENSVNHDPTTNLDSAGADYSITSITDESALASVKEIIVTKYGMSGATFNLSKLVKFYVTPETREAEYTNISFKLSTTYFGSDVNLEDLFGENGMITLMNGEETISDISESTLQTTNITSLKLNHNFGENHKITFLVTDESGAVNYTFVLNILNNTSVSAPSSISTGNDGGVLYANVPRGNINAKVSYTYGKGDKFPENLLKKGYIVPNGNEGNYIISQESVNAVGNIDENGNVTFNHFFKETAKSFAITFRPEGDNAYALSYTINFKVTRNVQIVQDAYSIEAFEPDQLDISSYFKIKQISDNALIERVVNYYIGTSGDNYLVADESGNLLNSQVRVAQNLTFDYGITSLTQKIVITVNSDSYVDTSIDSADVYQETLGINVVLPEGFWRDLAKDLTDNDNSTPSWQFAGGTNKLSYLVFENEKEYKIIDDYNYGENRYVISISQRDGDNRLNYYTVINEVAEDVIKITYKAPNNDLLYGYGEGETVYTYMTLTQDEKTIVLRVPTIISQIGTNFVSYSQDENNNAIFDENSLDLSKQSWSQLYADAKYNTVTAGSKIKLRDFINLPANFNITTSQSFTVGGSAGANVQNAIGSLIYEWTGKGALTLNHLSSAIENAYLFIEYTISTASGTESFGYLFKVEPSVVLDEPNYPYGGAAEYITMSGSQTPFDLDETFNSTTVQNGHSRFEYTFDPEIEDAEDLLYTDQVVSVRVGTQTYTNPAQWSGYINAQISVDTSASSSTRDHSFLVLSSLNTAEVVEIVVRRSYAGEGYSGGQKRERQAIVGGTIDYRFVLNDNRNYTIRVENESNIQNGVTDYTWDINNWANDKDFIASSEDPRKETRTFYLVENWQAGSATSGNIIENRLYFNLHNQTVTKNDGSFTATSDGLKFTFAYSNSGPNNGTFTVAYPSYLSKDHTFSATLYTDHGALSEVTFVFHADANASLINDNRTFDGGQDYSIDEIATIKTSADTNANITEVQVVSYKNGKENLTGFVKAEVTTLKLASTVEDIVGDLTLTVSWSNRSYTFTIPNFTIKANIEQEQSLVFDNQIGGTSLSITADGLLKNVGDDEGTFSNNNSTITLTTNPSNSAIDKGNSTLTGESLNIKFNQVGAVTEVTMPVTVTVTSAFGTNVSTEITINVTFRIYPSVQTYVSYPNPTGNGALTVEYIENGTTFANFGTNFLDDSAIFEDNARVNVEYAQVVGDEVVYNSVVITKQDGINYFTVKTSSIASGALSDYTGSITVNGKTLNYVADSGYDITNIPTGTEIRLTSSSFSGSINKFAVTYNGQTTTAAISQSDASTILPERNKRVTISSITNAVVTDVTNSGKELRINDKIELTHTITFARGINSGTSQVELSISYNNYVMDYTIQIVDTAFVLSLNQASNNISADSVGQYETLYVDKTDSANLLAENRMLKATLSSSARADDYYIFFILNKNGAYIASDVLASKIINLSENFVNNSRNSTIYLDLGNNSLSNVVLGSESGKYTPVMISDSAYESVLQQKENKNDALVYIAQHYNDKNATIKLTNYFDSTFTNASLSSRVTMTYGGHEVSYNKMSSMLKYHTPVSDATGSLISAPLNIATSANIGTSTTAITKFSFGYRNGGAHWEAYTSDIPATGTTYTCDPNTKNYTFTSTAGTEISIPTNALRDGLHYRVIYNNSYYYSNTDGQIAFKVVSGINTFKVEKFVEKRTPDVYSITKTFQVSYRYLADLDIEVGILADNGGSVDLEANATINLVEKFNVRRKTTGEKIQMSDMVSGNAEFELETTGGTNEVGSAKYLSISAVRTDEPDEDDRTTYDWVITGNGASNNGNDVSLSLKYKRGDFIKTFNLTVHVVADYNITFNGSGDKSTEEENGKIIYSNKGRPYVVNTSSFTTNAQILLAGESKAINGGAVASTPYMSITHRNASAQGERSVLDFDYTIIENAVSGDTTYNISGNIDSKLNFGEGGQNNWTEYNDPTRYTWTRGDATSLIMTVNKVEFGSQFYRIKLVDKYGYTIYLYFTLDSGEEDPEIYTTAGDSSLSLTEGERVAFGAQYQELTVTANNGGEVTEEDNKLTITAEWKTPSSAVSSIKMINIRNIDAWGFNEDYTTGNVAYFVGADYGAGNEGYKIGDNNIVGNDGTHTFILEDEKSQEYLKLPNFRYVTIDSITYYYNNGGSLIKVGNTNDNLSKSLATDDNLSHAGNTPGGNNSIYKNADNVSLNLPTISQGQTWIYGNANQVALTMVVRLKYEEGSNTEYFDISQDITLSKTTQISEQNNLVADNEPFNLKDYINVTESTSDVSSYTIYDDTLAVAVKPNSRTTFDLVYNNKRVSYSLNNANYGWEKLYYISLSERFDTVLTNGKIVTIIPKDENATFYYGIKTAPATGNEPLDPANNTSFVKVANVDYFTVETCANNVWSEYTGTLTGGYSYVSAVGGYRLNTNAGATVEVTFANTNYRIKYNNTYYYPAQTLTIGAITQDRITISNKNDMSNGTVSVYQYYVIQAPDGDPYRYRANFTVSGTYQSVYAPNQLTTLPLSGSAPISQWANGAKYTQIGAGYELSFTVVAGTADTPVTSFTAKNKSNSNITSLTINGISKTSTNGQYTIDNAKVGDIVVVRCLQDFTITYNSQTISSGNSYRAIYVENNLSSYRNSNNLYFVITSDNESGTGGTGLATIDATNGTINLLEGFNADHFVTVQIYQKVSGIDGRFSGTDVKQMHLLGELRVYPAPTRQISGGG